MTRIKNIVLTASAALVVGALATACSSSGGSSNPKPVAALGTVTGNSTSVALDPGFVSALTSLKLTPGTVGTATISKAGVASFPITGGHVTVYKKGDVTPYVQGVIEHNGSGLSLTAGKTVVELKNFVINPGNDSNLTGDVTLDGKVAAKGARLFDLDGSTLKTPTLNGGVATLTGTTVYLSNDAAALLDKAFGTTAVKGGLKIGVATLEVTGH